MRLALLHDEDLPVDFGRYRLLSILGEGGMARVFRAELRGEQGFRKLLALKVVRVKEDDTTLRAALVREARLGGMLHHRNVVETYDFGELDGQFFVAMELVDGLPLDAVLTRRGWLPPLAALEVADAIAAALEHATSALDEGRPLLLVHRDLKPGNVLVTWDGQVKVADFGIARAATLSSDTATGITKGTPSYMSPEQLSGDALDTRSDLFALGAILWELVLGNRLHEASSLPELVLKVIRIEDRLADPGNLAPLDGQVPGLADLVQRCLRRDRDARWPNAQRFREALAPLLARADGEDLSEVMAALRGGATDATAPVPVSAPGQRVPTPMGRGVGPTERDVGPTEAVVPRRTKASRRGLLLALFGGASLLLLVGLFLLPTGPRERSTRELASAPEPPSRAAADGLDPGAQVAEGAAQPGADAEIEVVPGADEAGDGVVDGGAESAPVGGRGESGARGQREARPEREVAEAREDRGGREAREPLGALDDEGPPRAGRAADSAEPAASSAPGGALRSSGAAPSAAPGPEVLDSDWEKSAPRRGLFVIRYLAWVRCGADCTVTLHHRSSGQEWESVPMVQQGERWTVEREYPQSAIGHVNWAVTVRDATGTAERGSRAEPLDFFLR